MLIKRPDDIPASEITDPELYRQRRRFLQQGVAVAGAALTAGLWLPDSVEAGTRLANVKKSVWRVDEPLTPYRHVTGYNNFYEFGTSKAAPARYAPKTLKPRPWRVTIDGECEKPGRMDIDDLIRPHALEERIYRFRCVEAWSMVIPWVGIPLGAILRRFRPTSKAKYVRFETLLDPEQMPGQRTRLLRWPYVEGLRIDEAMHPLTILAVGLYGEVLPHQNGAPLRLVVPWKYGFKSIKSIVRISFVERMPRTSWNLAAPHEYGFYANVNPHVAHPRWSQRKERRIGEFRRRKTLMFNGYADQVAGLYKGMDLRRYY